MSAPTSSRPVFFEDPRMDLGGGRYLLQIHPSISAQLGDGEDKGWLFEQREDGSWSKLRAMSFEEIEQAWDQVSAMAVQDANPIPSSPEPVSFGRSLLMKLFGARAADPSTRSRPAP